MCLRLLDWTELRGGVKAENCCVDSSDLEVEDGDKEEAKETKSRRTNELTVRKLLVVNLAVNYSIVGRIILDT